MTVLEFILNNKDYLAHLFRNLGIRTKYSCIPTYF